jgi:hypothetical protein
MPVTVAAPVTVAIPMAVVVTVPMTVMAVVAVVAMMTVSPFGGRDVWRSSADRECADDCQCEQESREHHLLSS